MERGGWIRGADGQEKGDGDGQKASGIGCRGDEKRMPNQSRPFKLAGPFPPAPLPLEMEMEGPAEAQSGFRNLNEWPALGPCVLNSLDSLQSVSQSVSQPLALTRRAHLAIESESAGSGLRHSR